MKTNLPLDTAGSAADAFGWTCTPEESERIAQANARDLRGLPRETVQALVRYDVRADRILEILFGAP